LIKEAKKCGADAVKFQAYTPDSITVDAIINIFASSIRMGRSDPLSTLQKGYTPLDWFKKLNVLLMKKGSVFLPRRLIKIPLIFRGDQGCGPQDRFL